MEHDDRRGTASHARRPADGSKDVFVLRQVFCQDRDGCLLPGKQVFYEHPVPNPREEADSIKTNRILGPGVDAGKPAGMLQGTVASWNHDRGFGFITPQDGGQDCFVLRNSFSSSRDGALTIGSGKEGSIDRSV
eukprot:gene12959-42145_t